MPKAFGNMIWWTRQSHGHAGNTLLRLSARDAKGTSSLLWDPKSTALIICDMWDCHWCKSAARRCAALAARVNEFAEAARRLGVLVVHAPSDTMTFYAAMPQRARAKSVPTVTPPLPIKMRDADASQEPSLPIDDSDGGCDDAPRCTICFPWKRQHPAIIIAEEDVISDSGQEIYNIFVHHRIKNILMAGVHTNKCILARPFGIRQMVMLGMNVILVRDLTDSLYNPSMPPFVSHDRGTELVIGYIEKYWCPSINSGDVASGLEIKPIPTADNQKW
jgi:nicotinamidase-related amidase